MTRSYLFKLFSVLLLILAFPVKSTGEPTIAVIKGSTAKPFQQTLLSFKSSLIEKNPKFEFVEIALNKNIKLAHTPALVFALGSNAVKKALLKFSDTPLLATMITNANLLNNKSNTTGILLRPSPLAQLKWHKKFLPNAKRVGVLFSPENSQQWVEKLKLAAKKTGLQIIAVPISSAKQLPSALKALSRNADSILGITDKTNYSGKTAKAILLFSFRNRIPFVGLSTAWAKAGALYALDWNYQALGHQSASAALQMLDGTTNSIRLEQAYEPVYIINLKSASHFKLNINQQLINGAAKVYR